MAQLERKGRQADMRVYNRRTENYLCLAVCAYMNHIRAMLVIL